jgi:broad specificity phosphatase PhoE
MQEGPPDGRIASDVARPAPDHSLALSLFPPGRRPVNELLLARHGETEWSASGRHTSRTDLPLTGNGRQLAGRMAPRLADRRFALVLTSPLRRAVETCELASLGNEAQVREELREWDYGDYEGITTAEIQHRRPGWSLWRDGCPNGEVAAEVGTRADRVIAEVRAAPADSIAFGHGHMLRVLAARWLGMAPENGALFALGTGTLSTLGYEHGTAVIWSWNELPS